MAVDPYSTAITAGGVVVDALQSRSANRAQKENLRRQTQGIEMQNQNFRAAQPYYQPLIQEYARRAGVQTSPGVMQTGEGHFALTPSGGDNRNQFGTGGQWGSYEDQLRIMAQEELNRKRRQQGESEFLSSAGQQGLSQGMRAAALRQMQNQGSADDIAFRRQLAIMAPQEQERRLAQLQGVMGQGFNQGSQAIAGYGQQAGVYGQQEAAANQGMANLLQNWQYMNALQNQQQAPGNPAIATADSYQYPGIGGRSPAPWSPNGNQLPWWMQDEDGRSRAF